MNNKSFRDFIVFWSSQAVSQLGSAMTSYALIIWAFTKTGSALTVSLMAFASFTPYIIVSVFAGTFIDNHSKKAVIACADSVAALCTAVLAALYFTGKLEIWHVYAANVIIGFMNAFQSPAVSVLTGMLVPKDKLSRASGMDSFTSNLVTVASPMLAAALVSFSSLGAVMALDIATFLFATAVLILRVRVVEKAEKGAPRGATRAPYFAGFREGLSFLGKNTRILKIMLFMAAINFFSRLTYENILPAMLLARSGRDTLVYGTVSAVLGAGGVIGGLLVSALPFPKKREPVIFLCAAGSFLFGDMLMGAGRSLAAWCVAGLAASVPIPFIQAGQKLILYETVPEGLQGRVFSVRNAVQFSLIPLGILTGGLLADRVFEPFMAGNSAAAAFLSNIVGTGEGSGMAVMFLMTGILGAASSIAGLLGMRKTPGIHGASGPQADKPAV